VVKSSSLDGARRQLCRRYLQYAALAAKCNQRLI
jgi:hypothetical protein